MMRDRVRQQQSLDAQAQYNAFSASNSESESNPLITGIGIILGLSAAGGFIYFLKKAK